MKLSPAICLLTAFLSAASICCTRNAETASASDDAPQFVTVSDGNFMIGDSIYKYKGANMWYAAILGSEGQGGDRARLIAELDTLKSLGIDNLRILAGAGEGDDDLPCHIMPVLQTAPGVYNDTILEGLDFLLAELEKRDMKAVLYLNNSWEWSGGYGTYLEWAGKGKALIPAIDGYNNYCDYVAQFVTNDSAKKMAADHVRKIVGRTNSITGKPYSESPAIMSWQVANEPRAFARDSVTKESFYEWVTSTASLIKSLDPNHLVSTGSEGYIGCEGDLDLWTRIHTYPDIDYANIHIWPYNWGWASKTNPDGDIDQSIAYSYQYIKDHSDALAGRRPLVIEEFGYPRENGRFAVTTPTGSRDKFYEFIFSIVDTTSMVKGCNFWAWGGDVVPPHADAWQKWDPYTGDPAQEPQGLYSVFAGDSTTISLLKK